jgi:hypothetical protein
MESNRGAETNGGVATSRDRRAKFVQLAESRTQNAMRAIRVIGKLANKSHYQYGEADVTKIVTALKKEIEALRVRLSDKGRRNEVDFKL